MMSCEHAGRKEVHSISTCQKAENACLLILGAARGTLASVYTI